MRGLVRSRGLGDVYTGQANISLEPSPQIATKRQEMGTLLNLSTTRRHCTRPGLGHTLGEHSGAENTLGKIQFQNWATDVLRRSSRQVGMRVHYTHLKMPTN